MVPPPLLDDRTSSFYSNRVSFIQRAEASSIHRRSVCGNVQVQESDLRRYVISFHIRHGKLLIYLLYSFSAAQAASTSAALKRS